MSKGDFNCYLRNCFSAFNNPDVLIASRLICCSFIGTSFLLPGPLADEIMSWAWKYCLTLVSLEFLSLAKFRYLPPGNFSGLLDPGQEGPLLSLLQLWWQKMNEWSKEKEAHNAAVTEAFHQLLFPEAPWVLEIFVALAESNFTSVPDDIKGELKDVAMAFQNTTVTETAFNDARDGLKGDKAGKGAANKLFNHVLNSNLLDDWDRPTPQTHTVPYVSKAGGIPDTAFKARENAVFFSGWPVLGGGGR